MADHFSSIRCPAKSGTASYKALQVQYQRRLRRGLQALASYTLGSSRDNASADLDFDTPNASLRELFARIWAIGLRRTARTVGRCHIRPAEDFQGLLPFAAWLTNGDSMSSFVTSQHFRSARQQAYLVSASTIFHKRRLDLVPGQPLYIADSQCQAEDDSTARHLLHRHLISKETSPAMGCEDFQLRKWIWPCVASSSW